MGKTVKKKREKSGRFGLGGGILIPKIYMINPV
jgi:hypothetical protein